MIGKAVGEIRWPFFNIWNNVRKNVTEYGEKSENNVTKLVK